MGEWQKNRSGYVSGIAMLIVMLGYRFSREFTRFPLTICSVVAVACGGIAFYILSRPRPKFIRHFGFLVVVCLLDYVLTDRLAGVGDGWRWFLGVAALAVCYAWVQWERLCSVKEPRQ